MTSGMRAYILDPGLRELTGHHAHGAQHVGRDLGRHAADLRIYGHKEMNPELARSTGARPLFRLSHYQQPFNDEYDGLLQDLLQGSALFADDVRSLGTQAPGDDDLVFLPTCGPREALGVGRWAQRARRKPRVAMLFHRIHPADLALVPGALGGALYRHAGRALAANFGARCLVGATNTALARALAAVFDRDVPVLPPPLWYGEPSPANAQTHARPVIAFLGYLRPEKGHGLIPPLVRALRKRDVGADVLVHVSSANRAASDLTEYQKLEREGLATLVNRWLPEDELGRLIGSASLVTLPYGREHYTHMISGVFCSAVAAGRPCVVPSDTWMAEQLSSGRAAGVSYGPETVDSIADAIVAALGMLPELGPRAQAAAAAWRREQSGGALISKLMAWAAGK
jgi:glycosyltransferase involved in cell wall biosynthesis